jgi:peptide/nickel transport system substrate-binding protein
MSLKRCLAALLLATLTACGANGPHRRADAGTFVFTGLAGEPDSLNPLLSAFADMYEFSHLYMSYLIESNDRGELIPEIALQVPTRANGGISADGKTYVYHLRPNVRWQDGAPLTARDVAFSYRAVMNPSNNVATRIGYDRIARIDTQGDRTVIVHLKTPFSPFTAYFFGPQGSPGVLLPAHLLARYRNLNHIAYNALPVGAGPFRVISWQHGDRVVLQANPLYWRGTPAIKRIFYRIIPDPSTRLQQLRTGEADAYLDVDPQLLPQVRTIPSVHVYLTPIADLHVLRFNLREPALRDVRVRRAIAQAIDRKQLLTAATHGSGIIVDGDQPKTGWAFDPRTPAIRYDPVHARHLLQLVRGNKPLNVTLAISPAGMNGSTLVATVLQRDLQQAGVNATIKSFPPSAFWGPQAAGGILASGKFDLAYDGWWILGPDPDDTFNLACDQRPPGGVNYDYWCDPQADKAMHEALTTVDVAARKRDYAIVQQRRAEQLPEFTLWQVRMPDAFREGITGVRPSSAGSIFWNAWTWKLQSSPTKG